MNSPRIEARMVETVTLLAKVEPLLHGYSKGAILVVMTSVVAAAIEPLDAKERDEIINAIPEAIRNILRNNTKRAQGAREQPATSDGQTPPSPAGRGGKK